VKTYRRSRGIAPLILNLGASCRLVFNITSRPLYPRVRTRYPLNRKLYGFQSHSGRFGEHENVLPLPGFEAPNSCRLVAIPTALLAPTRLFCAVHAIKSHTVCSLLIEFVAPIIGEGMQQAFRVSQTREFVIRQTLQVQYPRCIKAVHIVLSY
jgi:hypothetical protein